MWSSLQDSQSSDSLTNLLSFLELPVTTISLLNGTLQVLKEPIFLKHGEGCATSSRTPNLQFLNVLATSICWDGWLLHISAHWTSSIRLLAFLPIELAKDMTARMHHGILAHLQKCKKKRKQLLKLWGCQFQVGKNRAYSIDLNHFKPMDSSDLNRWIHGDDWNYKFCSTVLILKLSGFWIACWRS